MPGHSILPLNRTSGRACRRAARGHAHGCMPRQRLVLMAFCSCVAAATATTCRWCESSSCLRIFSPIYGSSLRRRTFSASLATVTAAGNGRLHLWSPPPHVIRCALRSFIVYRSVEPGQIVYHTAEPFTTLQHAAACIGARLHVSGGALGGGKMVRAGCLCRSDKRRLIGRTLPLDTQVEEKHTVVILDTAAGMWP